MSLPEKRLRSSNYAGRDRLSEMPDEVIVHILSCLPTVDAVRSVLLRRFGDLWTLVHTLRFDVNDFLDEFDLDYSDSDNFEQFITFVRSVLMLHKQPSIHKFHLCLEWLPYKNASKAADDLKILLRVALDKQAKEIELSDLRGRNSILTTFKSRSLVTLVLNHCEIDPQVQVNLGSLKKLVLDSCLMSDEAFQRFISGCPSLRELGIVDPSEMTKISFSASNVHNLSLLFFEEKKFDTSVLLDCPNLKTLDLHMTNLLKINNVSSVRYVNVKHFIFYCKEYEDEGDEVEMFLGKFETAEVLKLSADASETFLHVIHLRPLKNRWKRVILELRVFCQSCLLGICWLMSSLEHLEELVIYTIKGFKVRTVLVPVEHSSSCGMPQLKTITLHGHVKSWNRQQQLVESLLKSAPFLDKLVILPSKL